MSYTTKRKIMNSTVYLVLGLVVAAVVTITVVTFVSMRSHKQPENPVKPSEHRPLPTRTLRTPFPPQ